MIEVIGNKKSLLSVNGTIDCDKCIDAIVYMADITVLDVDKLNKISEEGGIYIKPNGKILPTFDKSAEASAKYKMVPTGLKQKYTEYPLFASFIKLNGMWEGAFIGTGTQLFKMYKQHYGGKLSDFSNEYLDIFGGERRTLDICGFGLDEVIKNNKQVEVNSEYKDVNIEGFEEETNNTITSLEKAIEKCLNESEQEGQSGKKTSKNSKKQRKAQRLQMHLDKVKQNEEKKKKQQELELEQQRKAEMEQFENAEVEEVNWADIVPIEESVVDFEDTVTKEIKQKLNDYINDKEEYETEDDAEEDNIIPLVENFDNIDEDDSEVNESAALRMLDHDYINSDSPEKEKYKMQIKGDLIQDIYERLLSKEVWKQGESLNRLYFYLSSTFMVVKHGMEKSNYELRGNGYNFSDDKSKSVINTGLIDVYGNYIYIIDHTPYTEDFSVKKLTVLNNKTTMLKMGFSLHNTKKLPEPTKFVQDKSQLIFDASYEDFDLDDETHLKHIIEERRSRFPSSYSKTSSQVICDKIKTAIDRAVKISKTDYRYVLPKYDFYRHKIQFLIPFHIETSIDETPELTIVVGETNGIWRVYTVLYTEDAYDDARLLCRPSESWVSNKNNPKRKDK